MRTLGILTITVGLLAVAACSSADPIGDPLETAPNKAKSAKPTEDDETPTTRAPAATPPAATPPPATPDLAKDGIKNADETDVDCGGAKAAGCDDGKTCSIAKDCKNNLCTEGKCAPPKVQTTYCQQLPSCCNSLASTVEKFACIAVQFAGKEIACQAQLAVCSLGGIGGTPCGNLNKCCDYMQADGYPQDAADCRSHNTGNASQCSSWLSQYQNEVPEPWCP